MLKVLNELWLTENVAIYKMTMGAVCPVRVMRLYGELQDWCLDDTK